MWFANDSVRQSLTQNTAKQHIGWTQPMRLLAVFVHEFGHASACWMTGGKVKKSEFESQSVAIPMNYFQWSSSPSHAFFPLCSWGLWQRRRHYRLHRGLESLCDSCWLRGCRILGRCLCSPQWVSYRSNHRRLLDHLLFADFFIVSDGFPWRYHGGVSKSIESLTFVLHSTFIQSRSQQNCRVHFAWFQHHFDWFDHHRMAGLRSSTGVCHSFLWCKWRIWTLCRHCWMLMENMYSNIF